MSEKMGVIYYINIFLLLRFVLCVPAVSAPQPRFHVSHPPPSKFWGLKRTQAMLQQELSSRSALLHPIASAMVTQFPDPRLIQYDCGELFVAKICGWGQY
jgi:E1A-binding protein p400